MEYIYNGIGLEVVINEEGEVGFAGNISDCVFECCTKEEAIAAAKAILAHFWVVEG